MTQSIPQLWTADEDEFVTFQNRYRHDIVGFITNCFDWGDDKPADYQLEIAYNLMTNKRASARGPHGLGKTALSSQIIIWFALTNDGLTDWKIPTLASAWRQLTKFLWPEIHKWCRMVKWDKVGRSPFRANLELLSLSLKLKTGSAFAIASSDPAFIEGAHASKILYLFDESKTIPAELWDAAEGAMSSGDAYWLAVSTPGEPLGRFYDIHSRKPGYDDWWVRHVTKAEAVAAGRIDPAWAEARKLQWGSDSAVYQNRVEGQFAASEEDGVVPLAWIELANQRYEASARSAPLLQIGLDPARMGGDKSVKAKRFDRRIELEKYSKLDLMELVGLVAPDMVEHPGAQLVVDIVGVGAGVHDRAAELYPGRVWPFHPQHRSDHYDRSGLVGFADTYSAAWWNIREMLDPNSGEELALPPDDDLTGDLTAPRWTMTSGGKIKVEPKEKVKERLGRSPDSGDATVMCVWNNFDAGIEYR